MSKRECPSDGLEDRASQDDTKPTIKLTPSQRLAAARRAGVDTRIDLNPNVRDMEDINDRRMLESSAAGDDDEGDHGFRFTISKTAREEQLNLDKKYRGLFEFPPDFEELTAKDEDFAARLTWGGKLNFNDPEAVLQLTKTLLNLHFGLRVNLPRNKLCPAVANRHNYVLWLKTLIDQTTRSYSEIYEPERRVVGLDIGTGASAIYPLLGCAQRPSWEFHGTEINDESITYARKNVALNQMDSRISIHKRDSEQAAQCLIPLDDLGLSHIDFSMTNPPFYASESEIAQRRDEKEDPPSAVCTGAAHEMVYAKGEGEGGEIGFVGRIVDESLALRERVQWYTAMLGKASSLEAIISRLKDNDVDNYTVTAFPQRKTRRWAIAWSFGDRRPRIADRKISIGISSGKVLVLPFRTEEVLLSRTVPKRGQGIQLQNTCWTQLETIMESWDLTSWAINDGAILGEGISGKTLRGVGVTERAVWNRGYRRAKQKEETEISQDPKGSGTCPSVFAVSVQVIDEKVAQAGSTAGKDDEEGEQVAEKVEVRLRWLRGRDATLFESLHVTLRHVLEKLLPGKTKKEEEGGCNSGTGSPTNPT